MGNRRKTTSYTSASGLTTGFTQSFFPETQENSSAIICRAKISLNSELYASVPTITLMTLGDFEAGLVIVPSVLKVVCLQDLVVTGGDATSKLTAQLKVAGNAASAATDLVYTAATEMLAGQMLSISNTLQNGTGRNTARGSDTIQVVLAVAGTAYTSIAGALDLLVEGFVLP